MYPSIRLSRRAINFRPGSVPNPNTRFRAPDYRPPPFPSSPPTTLHPSAGSINRTLPQELKIRRTRYPAHHLNSPSPLSDPELHDPTSSKRLPLKLDQQFHRFRERGFYPGTAEEGRAVFLQDMWSWRSRVRGEVKMTWNTETKQWQDSTLSHHFYTQALNRGQSGMDKPWEDEIPFEDLTLAEVSYQVRVEDLYVDVMLKEGMSKEEVDDYVPGYHTESEFVDWESVDENAKLRDPNWRSAVKTVITGKRIYLPNIIIRLVRNRVTPGEAYDPYMATFRIPLGMTKVDLRSYLKAVYGLDISFIRTDIYQGAWKRRKLSLKGRNATVYWKRDRGRKHDYKRAVVGLFEPFHYPDDMEELRAFGREAGEGYKYAENRQTFLAENFQGVAEVNDDKRKENRRAFRKNMGDLSKQYMEARSENQDIKFREAKLRELMVKRLRTEDIIANEAKRHRERMAQTARGVASEEIEKIVKRMYPAVKPFEQRDRKRDFRRHVKSENGEKEDAKKEESTSQA